MISAFVMKSIALRAPLALLLALCVGCMTFYYEWRFVDVNRTRPDEISYIRTSSIDQEQKVISKSCKIILDGQKEGIQEMKGATNLLLQDYTSDEEVASIAANCDNLRKMYQFPPFFLAKTSQEELDFPIAYSILAHQNINQVLMLLSAIYRDHNVHCIHLDADSSNKTFEALRRVTKCFPNVFISTERINVVYAHVSRLLADIVCMKDLLNLPKHTYNWKYLINLCSQDFPAKTNLEITRQLKEFKGFNSIGGYSRINDAIRERTQYVWKLAKDGSRPIKTEELHAPPPFNMSVVKNLAYNLYTREFLRWALIEGKVGPALLEWSMDTFTPDEHYWLMLHHHPNAPGGSSLASGYQLARQILWMNDGNKDTCHGVWRHYICVLGAEDVHSIINTRALFVNKFDITVDASGPICLRQILNERAITSNHERNGTNPDRMPDIPSESFFKKNDGSNKKS